jgi:hypothetical protein
MHLSLYLGGFIILLVATFSAIAYFRKKYTYTDLYAEGVKNENDGYYKAALENYSKALAEVEKYKFHEDMKQQIVQKIKVLKSAIEYESH